MQSLASTKPTRIGSMAYVLLSAGTGMFSTSRLLMSHGSQPRQVPMDQSKRKPDGELLVLTGLSNFPMVTTHAGSPPI